MAAKTEIRIKGQAELERAFLELRKDVFVAMKAELLHAGEAVRAEAQSMAGANIANIGSRWSQMRIGATVKGVYVAPKSKNRGGSKRPNLAGNLMNQAMQPALDAKRAEVEAQFAVLVDAAAAKNGFF